jgi:hypothetical protein
VFAEFEMVLAQVPPPTSPPTTTPPATVDPPGGPVASTGAATALPVAGVAIVLALIGWLLVAWSGSHRRYRRDQRL